MALKRPVRDNKVFMRKRKKIADDPDPGALEAAAGRAVYGYSGYHCRGPNGEPPASRAKPATRCPRFWAVAEATEALRSAIRKGNVSEFWEDDFPIYAWHRDDDAVYEARHTKGPIGTYHAYPVLEETLVGELKT